MELQAGLAVRGLLKDISSPIKGYVRIFKDENDGIWYSVDHLGNLTTVSVPDNEMAVETNGSLAKEFVLDNNDNDFFVTNNNTGYLFQFTVMAVRTGGTGNPEIPFGSICFGQSFALVKNVNGTLTILTDSAIANLDQGEPQMISLGLTATASVNNTDKTFRLTAKASNAQAGTIIKWQTTNINVGFIKF